VAGLAACGGSDSGSDGPSRAAPAQPDSGLVADGEALYQEVCSACHGEDLNGTDTGPPFLDPIYAPNHHSDEAFYAAVKNGVQPHHWDFGAMPPRPSVDPDEVAAIVAYVRDQQARAGITEDPSHP
jgi:mono/diheme cytochrome c family protein